MTSFSSLFVCVLVVAHRVSLVLTWLDFFLILKEPKIFQLLLPRVLFLPTHAANYARHYLYHQKKLLISLQNIWVS
jgi:hypothetical protein